MKKRTQRILTASLCAAMAMSLAACGGSSSSSSSSSSSGESTGTSAASTATAASNVSGEGQKLTLVLRGGTYADCMKPAIEQFEKDNGCEIEVLDLEFDDLHSKIALDATNKEGSYDLCMVDGSWMAEFTENKVLANLSDLGYKFDDDIIPATEDICKVGDDIYLAPYFGNVTVLLYNKQLIQDAGYTADDIDSFEDIMTIAQKTHDAGKNGFLVRGGSGDNIVSDFIPHLLAYGGWVVDDNNNPTVDTDEFKEAFTEYQNLFKLGDTMDKDDIVAAIDNGDAALAIGWPGWYVPTEDSNAGYIPIPSKATDDGEERKTSMYGTWTIGIPANSTHKELAEKLLEYVMSPDVQLASVENGGVPCRYSCLQDKDVLAKYPQYEAVCTALENGVYRPVIAQWAEFTETLGTEMDAVLQGEDMDTGLKNAQEQLEMLMTE